mgnify:CR=1 FL=1
MKTEKICLTRVIDSIVKIKNIELIHAYSLVLQTFYFQIFDAALKT